MYVDKMHSQAIRDADKYGIPQTVIHHNREWFNLAAVVAVDHFFKVPNRYGKPELVCTWLPANYFETGAIIRFS